MGAIFGGKPATKGNASKRVGKDVSATTNKVRSPYNNPSVTKNSIADRGTKNPC